MCKIHKQHQQHYYYDSGMNDNVEKLRKRLQTAKKLRKMLKLMQVIECLNCSMSHNLENRGKHTDSAVILMCNKDSYLQCTKHTH